MDLVEVMGVEEGLVEDGMQEVDDMEVETPEVVVAEEVLSREVVEEAEVVVGQMETVSGVNQRILSKNGAISVDRIRFIDKISLNS